MLTVSVIDIYKKIISDIYNISDKINIVIIDIRNRDEYNQFHINNAVNISFKHIMKIKSKSELIELINNDKKNYEKIIIYCETGSRSIYAVEHLEHLNVNAFHMIGGIEKYISFITHVDNKYNEINPIKID